MGEINETGHAMNVGNFLKLISYCQGYGIKYNPSNPQLQIAFLRTLGAEGETSLSVVNDALPPYNAAQDAREAAFGPLSPLATRLLNGIKATSTISQVDDATKTIVRKIKGQRASSLTKAEKEKAALSTEPQPEQVSASQQGFNDKLDNFDKLIKQLQFTPQYAPNEPELQVSTLQAQHADLKIKNQVAWDAEVVLSNARLARNKVLYTPLTGMVDVAFDVKTYVKAAFGQTSAEYKQISGLKFTPYKP